MNKATLSAYAAAVVVIVGGGFLSKYVDGMAGAALVGLGGYIYGKMQEPPAFKGKKEEAEPSEGP